MLIPRLFGNEGFGKRILGDKMRFESYFEESGMSLSDVMEAVPGKKPYESKTGYSPKGAPDLKKIKHSRMTRNPHVG